MRMQWPSRLSLLPLLLFFLCSFCLVNGAIFRRRSTLVCEHGTVVEGRCKCEPEFVGRHCERRKMCDGFKRYRNGTCLSCVKGYSGEYCENILCVHGAPDKSGLNCSCERPYSGPYCDDLNTKDVYLFYNTRVYMMGPFGALSLIPLCLILHGCEKMAQKRQVKRVGLMLGEQNVNVHLNALKNLLHE